MADAKLGKTFEADRDSAPAPDNADSRKPPARREPRRASFMKGSSAAPAQLQLFPAEAGDKPERAPLCGLASPGESGKSGDSRMSPPAALRPLRLLGWGAVAALGAAAVGILALARGEPVNAMWMVVAALC